MLTVGTHRESIMRSEMSENDRVFGREFGSKVFINEKSNEEPFCIKSIVMAMESRKYLEAPISNKQNSPWFIPNLKEIISFWHFFLTNFLNLNPKYFYFSSSFLPGQNFLLHRIIRSKILPLHLIWYSSLSFLLRLLVFLVFFFFVACFRYLVPRPKFFYAFLFFLFEFVFYASISVPPPLKRHRDNHHH